MRNLIFVGGADGHTSFYPATKECSTYEQQYHIHDTHKHYCDIIDEGDTSNPVFIRHVQYMLANFRGVTHSGMMTGMYRLFWTTRLGHVGVRRIKHLQLKAIVDGRSMRIGSPPLPCPHCDGTYVISDRPYFAEDNPDDIINFK